MSERKVAYYTVYLRKSEQVVAFGTPAECAKMLNMSVNTFHSTVYHTRVGDTNKYDFVKELIGLEEYREVKAAVGAEKPAACRGA